MGDELIGSPRLAVFELVKNAYDADASEVKVSLLDVHSENPKIRVKDDGTGMSLETIRDIWLVPAHDHRGLQRKARQRTAKARLPLGEKGLGRFAVHKLGDRIRMVTRASGKRECFVEIDWRDMAGKAFLSDANVKVIERDPKIFKDDATGTVILIEDLKEKNWTRGEVRRLLRQITSITSPFSNVSDQFDATLSVPDEPDWLRDVPDMGALLERAPWHFTFNLDEGIYDWNYEFRGVPGLKVEKRTAESAGLPLEVVESAVFDDFGTPISSGRRKKKTADATTTAGIGPIRGEFFVFDRDREVIGRLGDNKLIQSILDEQGGVRVYRDGIRVYNYGEPGDDWLGLDLRRVNAPTRNISRNIILGYIELNLETSQALIEKTNREGFVESVAYSRLRDVVLGAMATFEIERKLDKDRIRALTQAKSDPDVDRLQKPMAELRAGLKRHRLENEFAPLLDKIERDYNEMRESMLRAGISGTSLALVFHEVERGVRVLHNALREGSNPQQLEIQARELVRVLDGFSELLRKGAKARNSLKHLLREARNINRVRFRLHNVRLVCPALEDDAPDTEAVFSFGLMLGAMNNLIDNALHWVQMRWAEDISAKPSPRAIYLNIVDDLGSGPAIVMADTGPGFQDLPEDLVRPFFTRRAEGMGLGLYYTNLVMQLNDGELIFPNRVDADIPDEFDGAVLGLQFKGIE
ncbi:ATP-binding protein [Rhizobium fabae]|uniref:Anti-sigma regulatory factor (Ser/Thr protein kinase)/uncharacterized membrane-anchored protein YhcB (DUF1043 family) n=1 Tax=Rhizobium fabae TaxID=573179 RepID=A0A7W6B4R7_9HYPH|nr:ATP-binding protein [Rhizobium fabae]MBB3915580.1 anti-sigma regulatory factor (Ser/Thr protein kinase)/uncharacterized membrane-anchored protein YhcB (DUF1043 family) [Rhizobium fabae]